MMQITIILLTITLFTTIVYSYLRLFKKVTIFDYENGLFYKNGVFVKLLTAGKYKYLPSNSTIKTIDMRRKHLVLSGQEILTKDNINLKISVVGFYEISDPIKAVMASENYIYEIYTIGQIAVRDIIGGATIDELLENKDEINDKLLSRVKSDYENIGVKTTLFSIRDIMLPQNLKKAFSSILETKKESQKQLEKARGEQALLRNLANSSELYKNNQSLLQARIIQILSDGGNSIVFNSDNNILNSTLKE
ncbi:MAG: slipin family protein [Rickettsiales bacterium]